MKIQSKFELGLQVKSIKELENFILLKTIDKKYNKYDVEKIVLCKSNKKYVWATIKKKKILAEQPEMFVNYKIIEWNWFELLNDKILILGRETKLKDKWKKSQIISTSN